MNLNNLYLYPLAYFKTSFFLCTLLFLSLFALPAHAQRTIGVQWNIPENPETAVDQLHQFKKMGISVIELSPPVHQQVWETIDELKLDIYGRLDIQYPVTTTFSNPDSSFLNKVRQRSSMLLTQQSVKAIEFFSYGAVQQQPFQTAVSSYFKELKKVRPIEVYFTVSWFQEVNQSFTEGFIMRDFPVTPKNMTTLSVDDSPAAEAYRYKPSEAVAELVTPFYEFTKATEHIDAFLFVESHWLFEIIESHPSFKSTLQDITRQSDPVFPLPNESIPTPQQSPVPIILLLLIWSSVGLHYNTSPLYRKFLFRYFTAHKFFIDDIFQRQIRSAAPATIIIFQNAFLIAAAVYVISQTLFNPLGLDALFSYFPAINILGTPGYALAIWSFLLSLAIALVSVLWLYFSHKKLHSITQIATIYSWPLQINFILGTIIVVLFAAASSSISIAIAGLLSIFVQLLSFILSSFDATRFDRARVLRYQLLTNGIYIVIITALFIWGFNTEYLQDILTLAATL